MARVYQRLMFICSVGARHKQPVHASHHGSVQRTDHPQAQTKELPRHDHRGEGMRVGVCQGQGGDAPAYGASLQGEKKLKYT